MFMQLKEFKGSKLVSNAAKRESQPASTSAATSSTRIHRRNWHWKRGSISKCSCHGPAERQKMTEALNFFSLAALASTERLTETPREDRAHEELWGTLNWETNMNFAERFLYEDKSQWMAIAYTAKLSGMSGARPTKTSSARAWFHNAKQMSWLCGKSARSVRAALSWALRATKNIPKAPPISNGKTSE